MKESDINYFVRVKVVNQTLIAPDLTRFNTLPHNTVTGARFTDIYGDAFISGFVYGGEFNALMSVKLKDKRKMSEIKGALALKMDKAGLNVDAEAKLEIAKKDLAENAEISIRQVIFIHVIYMIMSVVSRGIAILANEWQ